MCKLSCQTKDLVIVNSSILCFLYNLFWSEWNRRKKWWGVKPKQCLINIQSTLSRNWTLWTAFSYIFPNDLCFSLTASCFDLIDNLDRIRAMKIKWETQIRRRWTNPNLRFLENFIFRKTQERPSRLTPPAWPTQDQRTRRQDGSRIHKPHH